ncbi:bifunctional diaminohydroxyphosphoribosylaminopyrimidine deaminase/5-amino-6-(5-phosphoribosylamino)uracil reductase RibD [Liquorilactobacillus ghanensis]|uniref:bifunctional diaminohydroxyphosphoribosylaminopyrimidine deaminase/5-amino-6-(5-phosphoribosylamino)uracil reductase RibD n=1 Tax=Liquorilactobacillus ghanensis TaxID=399370 RepID=UPI0039E9523D
MQLASELAQKGRGHTWTNPIVGAVIVKDDKILACGYHHQFGKAHAEIDALAQLADIKLARGATMYVTLEPCSHYGKTPPCAVKLTKVGIARVVIGQLDPNPLVAGKGCQILQHAGIQVTVLQQTEQLNPSYNFFYRHHRPLVTLKYAMSLDGKINAKTGIRSKLTGKAAYQDSQQLRTQQQAILIGEQTLKVDNPQLTVRTIATAYPPLRIVLVNDADQLDLRLQIFQTNEAILLLSRRRSFRQWPQQVEIQSGYDWSAKQVMQLLYQRGVQSLLIEGGSRVQAAFLAAGLVDRIIVYIAPVIYGGGGLPAVYGEKALSLANYQLVKQQQLGNDYRFELRRN